MFTFAILGIAAAVFLIFYLAHLLDAQEHIFARFLLMLYGAWMIPEILGLVAAYQDCSEVTGCTAAPTNIIATMRYGMIVVMAVLTLYVASYIALKVLNYRRLIHNKVEVNPRL